MSVTHYETPEAFKNNTLVKKDPKYPCAYLTTTEEGGKAPVDKFVVVKRRNGFECTLYDFEWDYLETIPATKHFNFDEYASRRGDLSTSRRALIDECVQDDTAVILSQLTSLAIDVTVLTKAREINTKPYIACNDCHNGTGIPSTDAIIVSDDPLSDANDMWNYYDELNGDWPQMRNGTVTHTDYMNCIVQTIHLDFFIGTTLFENFWKQVFDSNTIESIKKSIIEEKSMADMIITYGERDARWAERVRQMKAKAAAEAANAYPIAIEKRVDFATLKQLYSMLLNEVKSAIKAGKDDIQTIQARKFINEATYEEIEQFLNSNNTDISYTRWTVIIKDLFSMNGVGLRQQLKLNNVYNLIDSYLIDNVLKSCVVESIAPKIARNGCAAMAIVAMDILGTQSDSTWSVLQRELKESTKKGGTVHVMIEMDKYNVAALRIFAHHYTTVYVYICVGNTPFDDRFHSTAKQFLARGQPNNVIIVNESIISGSPNYGEIFDHLKFTSMPEDFMKLKDEM